MGKPIWTCCPVASDVTFGLNKNVLLGSYDDIHYKTVREFLDLLAQNTKFGSLCELSRYTCFRTD